jgi:hypothetical protein
LCVGSSFIFLDSSFMVSGLYSPYAQNVPIA